MATTYDKASLVMIPSGYKDDKLYAVKPTDGSGDFTFSRDGAGASPATRVNASGLIEKGRENILTYSNDFSNAAWVKILSSVTGGQSGYDGSSDAWLLSKAAASGNLQQIRTLNGVQTLSVYAKAGTLSWIRLLMTRSAGNSPSVFFNLSGGGSVGTTSGIGFIDASIESIGSGWYRCSLVVNIDLVNFRIYPADGDGDVSGSTGNIYIQDAQLEQGLVATAPAIETTTAPVSAGLLGDMPRLDYSGGATCPSLLLEPSRVNSIDQSEYAGAWSKTNVNYTQNYGISPEGVSNSVFIESNSTSGSHYFGAGNISFTAGNSYVGSLFVKQGTARYFQLLFGGSAWGTQSYANFDLQEGVVTIEGSNVTADIEPYTNDWYRVSISGDAVTTALDSLYFSIITSGTSARVESHISVLNNEVYGAQVESGSYPTSYIPTYGSASTRGADYAYNSSASGVIGQTEGSGFVEFEIDIVRNFDYDYPQILSLSDGTEPNRISLFLNDTYSTARVQLYVKNGGGIQASILSSSITAGRHKIAYAYANNDFVLYMDGVQIGTDNAGSIPTCNLVGLNGFAGASDFSEIRRQQVLLFPTRLTNAELAAITSL